ncbi:MAG: zf-HC2 domain-containing protein [Paenibacillaceae bacterium]|nr:zf-HC2 domain-containing protein [Paenibacillaceae bacterium]
MNGCQAIPIPAEEWRAYRDGKLEAERRDELEEHLYGCDECLQRFMSELETEPAPETGHEPARAQPIGAGFADRVMSAIAQASPAEQAAGAAATTAAHPPRHRPYNPAARRPVSPLRRTLVQYAIAAAITILLMASGVFRHIGERVDQFDSAAKSDRQEESFSERLLVKTTAVLDNIHTRTEGGAPRE